jgi:porin
VRKSLFKTEISGRNRRSALFAIALSTSCVAAAETPDYDANTLTGGWNGLRAEQSARGWDWELGVRVDQMSVVHGGLKRGGRPASHVDFKLKADLEKIAGWSGTTALVNLLDDRGGKVNGDYVGSLLGVTNIEVPVATSRLFQAWIQKEWAEGQWSLLTGLYPIDTEFMVLDSAGVFIQPNYGALADLAMSQGPSIFNNSAFGLRGKWASADRSLYMQAAVLDGIPGDPDHPVGTRVKFAADDGVMAIMEIGHQPAAESSEADPGFAKYALGLWSYSTRTDDLVDVDGAGNPVKRRSVGWYALAEKTLVKGTAIGDISAFARYSQNDGNSIPIEHAINLGLHLKGPFKGRENDVAGLGYSSAIISDKYRTFLRGEGIASNSVEDAWELTYRYQVNGWLALQPAFQYIRHPGADQSVGDAKIIGLRLDIAL